MRLLSCLIGILSLSLSSPVHAESADKFSPKQIEFYEKKIRPLFVQHCIDCHGPDDQSGELRLDSVTSLLAGGKAGPAAIPGEADKSLLIQAVRYLNPDFQMPPSEALSKQEIADLTRWIEMKLPHPPEATTAKVRKSAAIDLEKEREFWSFQPVQLPDVPAVQQQDWPASPVDHFILAKLEKAGLAPAPKADKRTLLRRVTFDLIGLPPTPEEVAAFLADDSADAFAKVVDRLLDSPHYGERWARHWLDVVRYADSNGLDENVAHGNAWRYRDYVVNSLNDDKSYAQFVREQLAGDLLDHADDPALKREHLIATGFLSLGPKVLAEVDETKMEMDIIDEQISTFGQTFLGLTFGCARCHDHKFDPLLASDYYALAGVFRSTHAMDSYTKVAKWHENSIATADDLAREQAHKAQVVALEKQIAAVVAKANEELKSESGELPAKPETKYSAEVAEQLKTLRADLKTLKAQAPEMPTAMGVVEEEQPADVAIHVRGSHLTLGKVVPRQVPVVFLSADSKPFPADKSGRLELTDWLVSRDNPLTARVMVNRVWRWHFGEGIVRTPDNFGHLGDTPTHPGLLDWLASQFMDHDWSLKWLHRTIVLSKTYQMSSDHDPLAAAKDPENRLWWRTNIKRLEAEAFRDAVLSVTGQLDTTLGGSLLTVKNRDYFFNHTSEDVANYDTNRRSLYLPVVRNHLYEVFRLFDYADASVPNGDRPSTTVVSQALFSLNSEFIRSASEKLAETLLQDKSSTTDDRISRLYELAYSRPPREEEYAVCQSFLAQVTSQFEAEEASTDLEQQSWQLLCQAILGANEFLHLR